MFRVLALILCLVPAASRACDLALLLAVDVSGSVDPREYDIQRGGLAEALRDGVVSEALVRAEAQVALLQWTGSSRQRLTIPWTTLNDFDAVEALALRIETDMRIWRNFSTAVGEALDVGAGIIAEGPTCARRVIDVSGDGISNEGIAPRDTHPRLAALDITVNALVIEGADQDEDLTGYFYENVIRGEGAFVSTANGFAEYPERIRQKLLREITEQLSHLGESRRPLRPEPARSR